MTNPLARLRRSWDLLGLHLGLLELAFFEGIHPYVEDPRSRAVDPPCRDTTSSGTNLEHA